MNGLKVSVIIFLNLGYFLPSFYACPFYHRTTTPLNCPEIPDDLEHSDCCTPPVMSPAATDALQRCIRELSSSATETSPDFSRCALARCVFNGTNVHEIDRRLMARSLNTDQDPDWKPVVAWTIDHCFYEAARQKSKSELEGCNMELAYLPGCLINTLFQNCPQSKWTDSEECHLYREAIDCNRL